ncbi:ankyrin repeat domain-containing protein 34C-like [Lytechinus pictus]|uniref:ankyrin repeat domain-containing protein 34C-like n=1 Tax=Lytechinus pictus TaxID=7653 RepID=UPI00240E261B|nr:ankyrin repeat domain-containing protein 34C-like [Lytechinus pictus]
MIGCLPPRLAMATLPRFETGPMTASFVHTDGNALQKAVRLGKLRLTRLLVEGGTDLHSVDDNGRTALIIACMTHYEDDKENVTKTKLVKLLLENKANVNAQDKCGRTCLMYACMELGGKELIKLLLTYEADPRITDKNGSSALVYAVNAGDASVLSSLINNCKNKGKEVIIITTNDRGKERDTKQYLDVPPSLATSPPLYKCISPAQIELKPPNSLDIPSATNKLNAEISSPKSHRRREKQLLLLDSPLSPESSPRSPGNSPRSQRLQPSKGQSSIQTRRLVRRGSMGLLYDNGSISPTRSHPDLPEESEEEAARESSGSAPTLPANSNDSLHRSPRSFRRPLIRRQSADAFNPSSLNSANHKLITHAFHSPQSTPEKKQIPRGVGSSRRGSLPAMPPPLKKSQTVHAINVPKALLELKMSSDSNNGKNTNSLTDITNESNLVPFESGKKKPLLRRGSAPFLLEDELSYTRPGTLPPLNINPRPPIPDIGSTTSKPSPRLGRHVGGITASHDRRYSMQAEDIRRLTGLYQRTTDIADSQIDSSGDSGAESS